MVVTAVKGRGVALLAESVDRNCFRGLALALAYVALLAEGVDRNLTVRNTMDKGRQSPSSRRAWIEISGFAPLG